jgi:hypothetical protein
VVEILAPGAGEPTVTRPDDIRTGHDFGPVNPAVLVQLDPIRYRK